MDRDGYVWAMAVGIVIGGWLAGGSPATAQPLVETHWNVEQVDAGGNCIHPLVGAAMLDGSGDPIESNKVQLTGIALNSPGDLADTASEYLLMVQGEGDDHAGTQLWSGIFFHDPGLWPEYPLGVLPGDRVRVTGFIMDFIGKVNMNERHQGNPAVNFQVEVLEHVGMPEPEPVPSLAHANFFDMTRLSGGEWYQSRWVRINSVQIVGGDPWGNDQQVVISDGTGTLGMKLSSVGDFDVYGPPAGKFDVVAIFDQEPYPLDFGGDKKANYRIWVKRWTDVIEPTEAPVLVRAASRKTHGTAGELDIDLPLDDADSGIECRKDGLTTVVLTFSEGIRACDGVLDATEVNVTAGQVDAVEIHGLDMVIALSGVPDGSCMDLAATGIEDLAGNALAGDRDVRVHVLLGDTNGDDHTNLIDAGQVKGMNGADPAAAGHARLDVNVDGEVNLIDFAMVKGLNGGHLTCPD